MARVNGTSRAIHRITIIGDNRTSDSVIHALSKEDLDLHQLVPRPLAPTNAGLTFHKTDLSPDSLDSLFRTINPDLIISTVSGGSFETQKSIIDCVISTGIRRFIAPDFGHDSLNTKIQARLPPYAQRAQTISFLEEQASSDRIEWVAVAVGCSLDYGIQSGSLGFDVKWLSATLHGSGREKFAASSVEWVGRVVRSITHRWDEVKNRYLYACGLVTSSNDIVHCLEHATGKSWEVGRAEVGECVHEAERRIERGFPDAGMFLMERSVLYDENLRALQPFVDRDAKRELGLEAESLDAMIHQVLHQHGDHGKGGCGCD